MSKQKHYVYRFTFPDGSVYIGSTHDIEVRWQYGGTLYQNQPVGEAIKRFGWDNVKREVLFYSENGAEVEAEEKRQIALHKDKCYNHTDNPDWIIEYSVKPCGCKGGYVHVWTINGEAKPASDWCRIYGKDLSNVLVKIKRYGMTPLEAINAPKVPREFIRKPEMYWKDIGFEYGNDKTSYVTPMEEWPDGIPQADDLTGATIDMNGMALSGAVKEMLKRSNLTRQEVSEKTSKSYGTIYRALRKNSLTVDSLVEFANAAGYDLILSRRESDEQPIKIINPNFPQNTKKDSPSPATDNGLSTMEKHS